MEPTTNDLASFMLTTKVVSAQPGNEGLSFAECYLPPLGRLPGRPEHRSTDWYSAAAFGWDGVEPVMADDSIIPWLIVPLPVVVAVVFGAAWIAGGSL